MMQQSNPLAVATVVIMPQTSSVNHGVVQVKGPAGQLENHVGSLKYIKYSKLHTALKNKHLVITRKIKPLPYSFKNVLYEVAKRKVLPIFFFVTFSPLKFCITVFEIIFKKSMQNSFW